MQTILYEKKRAMERKMHVEGLLRVFPMPWRSGTATETVATETVQNNCMQTILCDQKTTMERKMRVAGLLRVCPMRGH